MARLRVRELDKWFGRRGLLRNVSFEAHSGETLALFGPSGCGKTTLLRILAGLDSADHGEVSLDGRALNSGRELVPPEDRGVAMLFQNLALWPHMTAERHLDFVLRGAIRSRAARDARIGDLLGRFGLSALADARPARLSGGEQQRLALARALALDASLVLLDEPFSHLDEAWRSRCIGELNARKRTGAVFVIATHHREDVRELADQVVHIGADGTTRVERIARAQSPGLRIQGS
jgi:ABC-type Fe3+/spermidine/putrescine transport system ATPase subunit